MSQQNCGLWPEEDLDIDRQIMQGWTQPRPRQVFQTASRFIVAGNPIQAEIDPISGLAAQFKNRTPSGMEMILDNPDVSSGGGSIPFQGSFVNAGVIWPEGPSPSQRPDNYFAVEHFIPDTLGVSNWYNQRTDNNGGSGNTGGGSGNTGSGDTGNTGGNGDTGNTGGSNDNGGSNCDTSPTCACCGQGSWVMGSMDRVHFCSSCLGL